MKIIKELKNMRNPIYFDRMIAKENLRQFLIVILLLPIVILAIGLIFKCILFHIFGPSEPFAFVKEGLFWDTYENYINHSSHLGNSFSRRFYLLTVGMVGVFLLNGILVSALVSFVEKRSERWKSGELRYDKKRWFCKSYPLNDYVIVIGGNEMIPELVKQLLSDKEHVKFVLIMTNRDVSSLRKKITSIVGKDEEKVVIYHGERIFLDDLSHLQVERANSIYVIGEQLDIEQSGSHHDVKNMECVKLISQLLHVNKKNNSNKKTCHVLLEYQSSFSVFQFTDVNSSISSVLDFRPFNYYETWVQKIMICPTLELEINSYLPLEGKNPITYESNDTVHLIVIGMSRMGMAMGIEAAHIAHYPNFIYNDTAELRTRITFIDSMAQKEMHFFQGHYKELFALSRWRYMEAKESSIYYDKDSYISYDINDDSWHNPLKDSNSNSPFRDKDDYSLGKKIVDVDWEFIQGNLEMPSIQCYIREAAMQKSKRVTIAICFPKDNASFAASLYLPDEVYDENNNVVQVLVYQPYGDAMCQSFKNHIEMEGNTTTDHCNSYNQFAKIKAFGMMSNFYSIGYQQKTDITANQHCKQDNNTYRGLVEDRNTLRKRLGKEILKAGKSFAACQWSKNYAAAHFWTKLRSIEWDGKSKIDDNTMTILAQLEHIRWNMEQLLLGYAPLRPEEQQSIKRMFQLIKDIAVPYDELMQLANFNNKELLPEQFPKLCHWLEQWEPFDEERELLKANMSHIDICSYEILEKIDEEAIRYDKDGITRLLQQYFPVYNTINNVITN